MQYSVLASQQHILRRNQNTTKYQPTAIGLGPMSHGLLVAIMVAIVGMIYLTQITKTSSFGYQVETLKNTRAELIEENENLEAESARLQALDRIKNSDIAKGLESANDIRFAQ